MNLTVKILRFNPEQDDAPRWESYDIDVEAEDRVLDALLEVKARHDGTLTLRKSCAHGVCGSDALRINGKNQLACRVLVKDVAPVVTVEPMKGFRVLKDLVVDMEPFFAKYRAVQPYLVNEEPEPERERLQSSEQRDLFEDTTKCILCGACTTSCPSFWADPDYLGPAAIVQAHRFIFDSRDRAGTARLETLNGREGVWRCHTIFNCVEACPREIDVTGAIADVKRELLAKKL